MKMKELSDDIFEDIKDIDEDLDLKDIQNIETLFENSPQVDVPDDLFNNIMDSIEFEEEKEESTIKKNEDMKEKVGIKKTILELIFTVKYQISLIDLRFWIISILIIISGILSITYKNAEMIFIFAPLFIIFSIYYMYRGIYYEVNELEKVCKYSLYEIILARSIIIIGYDILFTSIISIVNYSINKENLFLFLLITWLAPLLLTYFVSLYFFYKKDIYVSLFSQAFSWILYLSLAVSLNVITPNLKYQSIWFNINVIILIICSVLLACFIRNMKKAYS
ncbi:hypothetical protein GCM10008906_21020 [Clostridium oceanicum]|uniref:Uncharacterized protein n=2 Tax=Clostridium oceanicum TaxID=1543 RepID=A0ABN1JIQ4_9CLOT